MHVAFVVQAAIVLVLLAVDPQRDFVTVLFVLMCYEAAVVVPGLAAHHLGGGARRADRRVAGAGARAACAASRSALVPMAAGVVLSTYVVVTRELGAERAASERMVADLRAAHERLQAYSGQADELAAIEQRARVARDLEQSVTRTLASALEASAAARELLAEPAQAGPQLERLQELTTQALAQMRRVITELRPSQG